MRSRLLPTTVGLLLCAAVTAPASAHGRHQRADDGAGGRRPGPGRREVAQHLGRLPARLRHQDGRVAVVPSAGLEHTCEVKTDGSAYGWGDNSYGQLGNPAGSGGHATPLPVG